MRSFFSVALLSGVSLICLAMVPIAGAENTSMRLGAILPMSGNSAFIGASARIGIRAALQKINGEEGGVLGNKLEVVFEDSRSDPEVAITEYRRLMEKYNPPAVISALTNVATALRPVVTKERRLLFAQSSNPELTEQGGYVFRTFYTSDQPNTALLRVLKGKFLNVAEMEGKILRVAVIRTDEDWTQLGYNNLIEQLRSSSSIKIGAQEVVAKNTDNFRPQLTKLKKLKMDALYVLASGSTAAKIFAQIKELAVPGEMYGLGLCNSGSVSSSAKESLEGVFSVDPQLGLNKDLFRRLEKIYNEERPGMPIDMNSISTFDTILILAEALRSGASTSEDIKKFILKKKDFQGIAGTLSFDANGDAKWKSIVQLISGGKCVVLPD